MQDKKQKNNMEHDGFDKLLSSRLEGHCIPVDTDCWREIEKQIRPKRKVYNIWWYAVSAAVVGLLMLFIFPLREDIDKQNAAVAETSTVVAQEPKQSDAEEVHAPEAEVPKVQPTDPFSSEKGKRASIAEEDAQVVTEESVTITDNKPLLADVEEEGRKQPTVQAKDSVKRKKEHEKKEPDSRTSNSRLLSEEKLLFAKADVKRGLTFGLNVSTGGHLSLSNSGDMGMPHSDTDNPGSGGIWDGDISKEAWTVDYKLPVSVGFMVKKQFNNIIGIETGLVYTYLSSDLKRSTTGVSQKGTLQLHYMGVPVNAVANVWKNTNWNIYVSAGGMLEKGISMKEKMQTFRNNAEGTTENKSKNWISGTQWSINGAVGVSYNLTPAWSIYIEPRVSHYFDNKQPISIRTEKETLFNISGGIKFNLK